MRHLLHRNKHDMSDGNAINVPVTTGRQGLPLVTTTTGTIGMATAVGTIDRLHAHHRLHRLHPCNENMTSGTTFRACFFECFPPLFTKAGDRTQRSCVFTQRLIGHLSRIKPTAPLRFLSFRSHYSLLLVSKAKGFTHGGCEETSMPSAILSILTWDARGTCDESHGMPGAPVLIGCETLIRVDRRHDDEPWAIA